MTNVEAQSPGNNRGSGLSEARSTILATCQVYEKGRKERWWDAAQKLIGPWVPMNNKHIHRSTCMKKPDEIWVRDPWFRARLCPERALSGLKIAPVFLVLFRFYLRLCSGLQDDASVFDQVRIPICSFCSNTKLYSYILIPLLLEPVSSQ